jgi:hypothetical protein
MKDAEQVGTVPGLGGGVVPHIWEEGARFHILWWDGNGRHCSEPRCEENHPASAPTPPKSNPFLPRHPHTRESHEHEMD